MPALICLYLTALLCDRTTATCVAMSEALQTVSHDRLTRTLRADACCSSANADTWSSMTR
jgi:hypothetical protein